MTPIGTTTAGDPMGLDVERLIGSHACIVANSGGGKSGLIRRLLEVTHGKVQHIVLDVEDEFYSLRERFDYVIAGGDGGDAPAAVENAEGLALAALQHDFSLIVQLNDLGPDGAPRFVGRFLEALIAAPRALWRPVLVVLDEAQRFAPSGGMSTEATHGVRALTGQGRKRGFTAILASQRIVKIDPNVRGDVNNWLLGRVGQTIDRDTMADALGFTRAEGLKSFRGLEPRNFWAFGPALADEPTLFRVSDVETTPVRPGQAKVPTPPPPEALRAILQGLAVAPSSPPPDARDQFKSDDALHEAEVRIAYLEQDVDRLTAEAAKWREKAERQDEGIKRAVQALGYVSFDELDQRHEDDAIPRAKAAVVEAKPLPAPPTPRPQRREAQAGETSGLNSIGHSILDNLKRVAPAWLTWTQAAQMADRSPKSGPYFAAKKQLVALSLVETEGQHVRAGPDGEGLSRAEAIEAWRLTLEGFAPRMLAALADERPRTRQELGDELGLSIKSGPWFRGLKDLRERGLTLDNSGFLSLVVPVPGERP